MKQTVCVLGLVALMAGCASGDRGLRDFESGTGPDEFQVIPQLPLTLPEDLSVLPAPTPGGGNITDPNPTGDAIVALGGNPAASRAGGIPSSDAALVTYVARNGVTPGIRTELAQADAEFRERRARFGGGPDRYFAAYAAQALDAYAELERFRRLGVSVPSAPPAE